MVNKKIILTKEVQKRMECAYMLQMNEVLYRNNKIPFEWYESVKNKLKNGI